VKRRFFIVVIMLGVVAYLVNKQLREAEDQWGDWE
jgi:hypothetical protein